ncbi:MAG: hypothetical protein HW377_804, partial [Actinobacteria bacterium]|nr:hypothetical protein [Actinomycetota bacterium]
DTVPAGISSFIVDPVSLPVAGVVNPNAMFWGLCPELTLENLEKAGRSSIRSRAVLW